MFSRTSLIPQWVAELSERRMLDANEAALRFWRMTFDQFVTNSFDKFFHPEEMPRWETYIAQEKWGESGPWKCTRGDGSLFYCTTRWQMFDYQGVYAAIVFPLRAGHTPLTMVELECKEPSQEGEASSRAQSSD